MESAEAKVTEAVAEIKDAATEVVEAIAEKAEAASAVMAQVSETVAEVTAELVAEVSSKVAEVVEEVEKAKNNDIDLVKEVELTVSQTKVPEATFASLWPRSEITQIIFNNVIEPSKKLTRLPSLPRSPRRF